MYVCKSVHASSKHALQCIPLFAHAATASEAASSTAGFRAENNEKNRFRFTAAADDDTKEGDAEEEGDEEEEKNFVCAAASLAVRQAAITCAR